MSTHTPGPWNSFSRIGSDGLPEVIITASNGCPLAAVSNHGEYKENARLIAAAPELLGSLRDILSLYGQVFIPIHNDAWADAVIKAREKAEAIIARAESLPLSKGQETAE